LLGRAIVRNGRGTQVRLSAIFLVVLGVTIWLASYDWIMSLEPEWSSTVFGPYQFAGLFLAGLAAIVLLAADAERKGTPSTLPLSPRERGRGEGVGQKQRHDLGKLIFGFSVFWAYLWYCQYMLIWYVNNPEETAYFTRRLEGAWQPLFWTNLILNLGVPFLVLLPRWTKCHRGILQQVAVVVLVGRWLDLYLMIVPPVVNGPPSCGLGEIGTVLVGVGVCLSIIGRAANTQSAERTRMAASAASNGVLNNVAPPPVESDPLAAPGRR
jgi:hypothetical protein